MSIPISECKHGYLYKLNSRNLDYGIYRADTESFVGIREKFDYRFLESDGHRDLNARGCTALPTELIDVQYPLIAYDYKNNEQKLLEFLENEINKLTQ